METNGWNPNRKERAVVGTMSKKSGVSLSQDSQVIAMSMGLPLHTVERSIMGLNVVGT
jgi:hypothetical protein